MKRVSVYLTIVVVWLLMGMAFTPTAAAATSGAGNVSQGQQSDDEYAASYANNHVTNVMATTQKTSCYRPEVPFFTSLAPANGYSGMSECAGAANTGEDIGTAPYASQAGSNPGYLAAVPMLVKDHAESNLRVDPTNPQHLIGSSKWFVSAEGYNHLLGFYESTDGGKTWPVQGHIPGYEGWTDNTDPVGAFDGYGNYYSLILAYQFFYRTNGTHNFTVGTAQEPNPAVPAEVVAVAVRPHGATTAREWITTHNGAPDYVATTDSVGREPDKQWITIDTNPASPNYNTIYAMWTLFTGYSSKPYVATAKALPDGTHTDWTAPQRLPTLNSAAQDTYLLPEVDPSGVVYTTVSNLSPKKHYRYASIGLDYSTDGGKTWQGSLIVARNIVRTPYYYANTTFRDGILNTFAVGSVLSTQGYYPLYVAWEDYSAGVGNILLSASFDGGSTWSVPIQVNDNETPVDEFQPNLAAAPDGTVSVAFYDRRLPCPSAGTDEALNAGLALDTFNPFYSGSLPPYGAANYCVNASIQFYGPTLSPKGNNIRLTEHTWDPQLNAPHPSCPTCAATFIGDYFGNVFGVSTAYTTFVSTYDDGTNPAHRQQQVIAALATP